METCFETTYKPFEKWLAFGARDDSPSHNGEDWHAGFQS